MHSCVGVQVTYLSTCVPSFKYQHRSFHTYSLSISFQGSKMYASETLVARCCNHMRISALHSIVFHIVGQISQLLLSTAQRLTFLSNHLTLPFSISQKSFNLLNLSLESLFSRSHYSNFTPNLTSQAPPSMCYLHLTRYSCNSSHTSPIHAAGYQRPSPAEDARQASLETEWPTHEDTSVEGCQDACRRGARCPGRLEELDKILYRDVERRCEACRGQD